MPTYDYKCENCGHQFDVYQSMKDEKLTKCPNCGKNTLKRLIGAGGGLIFKGSGFYLTDYKNKPAETTSSSSPAKNKTSETTKTETTSSNDSSKSDTKTTSTDSKTSPGNTASSKSENKSSTKKTDKS